MKIGRLAVHQRATQIQKCSPEISRQWVQHIVLDNDGISDPKGIKVRPEQGIHACDYLVENPMLRPQSYVLGPLIHVLRDFGYEPKNLDAMTYDWRLPPAQLEIRDGYFTSLRYKITQMREINKCPVVLTGHSMGNKVIHYFLLWAQKHIGQEWIDHNVHAVLALGGPFLGAPKSIRSVVSGDRMDLDVFLTEQEGLHMCRRSASLPWLFPVDERYLPDVVSRLRIDGELVPLRMSEIVQESSKSSWRYFENYFQEDDLYLRANRDNIVGTSSESVIRTSATDISHLIGGLKKKIRIISPSSEPPTSSTPRTIMRPPVMEIPPVKNLWCVYGINVKTEVSFYFKTSEQGVVGLDHAADRFSLNKTKENPQGFTIAEGIAYETADTYQPTVRMHKSGDGTVPFSSLHYPYTWGKQAERERKPLLVQCIEVPGVEHRAMLSDDTCFLSVLEFVGAAEKYSVKF